MAAHGCGPRPGRLACPDAERPGRLGPRHAPGPQEMDGRQCRPVGQRACDWPAKPARRCSRGAVDRLAASATAPAARIGYCGPADAAAADQAGPAVLARGLWTGRLRQPRHPRPASGTADRRIRLQRARPARRSQRREDHRLAASAPARAARQRYWRPPPLRYYHCDVHLGECAFGAPLVRPSANRAPMGPRAVGLATAAVGLKARWRPARQVVTGLAATGTAQRARRGRRRAAAATGRPCAGTRL